MGIIFGVKDVLHKIVVRFVREFLPGAKKPYILKVVHHPVVDIRGIAAKGDLYNSQTPPEVIEQGLTAGLQIAAYLLADGYEIDLGICTIGLSVPGGYDGTETRLPPDVYPEARFHTSAEFRDYLKEKTNVEFDGIEHTHGAIGEAQDEATGLVNEAATIGSLIIVHGYGLKIEADEAHKGDVGLFFQPEGGGPPVRADVIAQNEPRTLKALVPPSLEADKPYLLKVVTQGSPKHTGLLLKEVREVQSEFVLTANA